MLYLQLVVMEAFTGDGLTPPLAIGGFATGADILLAEPDRCDLILIPDALFRSALGGVDGFSSEFYTFLASSFFSLLSFAGVFIFEGVWAAGSY